MFRRIPEDDERALAERLRKEAVEARPEFSEALHERICRAVEQCRQREAPVTVRRSVPRLAWRWAAVAAAAACLVISVVLVQQAIQFGTRPEVAREGEPDGRLPGPVGPSVNGVADPSADLPAVTGLAGRVAVSIPALVDSTVTMNQWAYLDHDARLGAELLSRRLPLDLGSRLGMRD